MSFPKPGMQTPTLDWRSPPSKMTKAPSAIVVHHEAQPVRRRMPDGRMVVVGSPAGIPRGELVYARNVDIRNIHNFHRNDRGWAGVGYHFVIVNDRHDSLPDGTIQVGRPLGTMGAHVAGLNDRSVGIMLVGNGNFEPMTSGQRNALLSLLRWLGEPGVLPGWNFERRINDVIEHREAVARIGQGATTCAGKYIDGNEIRGMLRETLAPSAPAPAMAHARWSLRSKYSVADTVRAAALIEELALTAADHDVYAKMRALQAFYR